MKISFVKLGEEECEMCDEHEHHLIEVHDEEVKELKKTRGTSLPKHDNCDKCNNYGKHVVLAIEAREHYKEDTQKHLWTNEIIMSTFKRLPGLKKAIFCKRLVMFNESFVPVGKKHGKGIGVLWHEGVAGRSTAEISSTFIDVLRSPRFRDFKRVTLWADNFEAVQSPK